MPSTGPDALDVEAASKTVETEAGTVPVIDHGEGQPVLLLHGFPDSRHLWRYQVPALAEAGYRAIAPDLRGFGDAPRPDDVDAYAIPTVAEDVVAVLEALDEESAAVVGHDWGAVVAWLLASIQPDLVERLVALSVGAPGAPGRRSIEQRERSWYIYFWQFEGVAEAWIRHDDWALFHDWLRGEGDVDRYLDDLSRPGALTAGLNWYRANAAPGPPDEDAADLPPVSCPVLGVWSDGDHYLTEEQMRSSQEVVTGPWRYERVTGASHWLQLDAPGKVNDLILDFLSE